MIGGMSKPFFIASGRSKPARTAEAVDVAARYFVYELFDITDGILGAWHVLGNVGERQATVRRPWSGDGSSPARSG